MTAKTFCRPLGFQFLGSCYGNHSTSLVKPTQFVEGASCFCINGSGHSGGRALVGRFSATGLCTRSGGQRRMFYSKEFLGRKTPLGPVWSASLLFLVVKRSSQLVQGRFKPFCSIGAIAISSKTRRLRPCPQGHAPDSSTSAGWPRLWV